MFGIEIDKKRIYGLDLLRAFAIFCVVDGHASHLLSGTRLEFINKIPLPHGVDIFFVISGFLIGLSFLSYADKNQGVNIGKTLRFYARTALRILPNYYIIMLIYCILISNGIVNGNMQVFPLWKFFTFTQNIVKPFYDFYWESWSLSVQWWFYIIFPLLLVIFSSMTVSVKKITPYICLFFIVVSLAFRVSASENATDNFWWDVWMRKTVASRMDNIYIGVLAAWIRCYAYDLWNRYAVKSLVIGVLLMIATFFIPKHIGTFYTNVVYLTVAPIAIALWLPYITRIKESKTFVGDIVSHFSILSYAMFLTNLMLIQIIDNNFAELSQQIGAWSYFIFWSLVIISSYILYIIVEKQFIKLRDKNF